jgi:hypothetical protein
MSDLYNIVSKLKPHRRRSRDEPTEVVVTGESQHSNPDATRPNYVVTSRDVRRAVELPNAPHGGKKITAIALSPSGTYMATYSEFDSSIVGWSITRVRDEPLKVHWDNYVKVPEGVCDNPGRPLDFAVSDERNIFIGRG